MLQPVVLEHFDVETIREPLETIERHGFGRDDVFRD